MQEVLRPTLLFFAAISSPFLYAGCATTPHRTPVSCCQTAPEPQRKDNGRSPATKHEPAKPTPPADNLAITWGFFGVAQAPGQPSGQSLLAIPTDRLGQEFLLHASLDHGLGHEELTASLFSHEVALRFVRHGKRVYLLTHSHTYTATGDPALSHALAASFSDSAIASAEIVLESKKDHAILIDPLSLLVAEPLPLAETLTAVLRRAEKAAVTIERLDRERSYVESLAAHPDALLMRAKLTYKSSGRLGLPTVSDERFAPLTLLFSFLPLPAQPMLPRIADERMGFFTQRRFDFGHAIPDPEEHILRRLRLQPGTPQGNLVDPVHPITFYLDRSIPEKYKPIVAAGVLEWNSAFAAAGYHDALRVEDLPKNIDPSDSRYFVIRWSATPERTRNGVTQPLIDPRSGEILSAHIVLDALALQTDYKKWWQMLSENGQAGGPAAASSGEICDESLYGTQTALLHTAMVVSGAINALDPVPAQISELRLRKTVMHEVGHALGLRHNFRASADVPVDKLGDREWLREHGVMSSIMDYPGLNLPAKLDAATVDFPYYMAKLGPADILAITYGYAPDERASKAAMQEYLRRGFAFSSDAEADADDPDPLVNKFDLGSDPLAWARLRTELIRGMWPQLPQRFLQPGKPYSDLTEVFSALLREYFQALSFAVKFIGGQYHYRERVGDPGGHLPIVPVEKAKQREALTYLLDAALAENSLRLPKDLLPRLGVTKSALWQEGVEQLDDNILNLLEERQQLLLMFLINPLRLSRMVGAEFLYGEDKGLTVQELLDAVTQNIFAEVWTGAHRPVVELRRSLQRSYVDILGNLLLGSSSQIRAEIAAVARYELTEAYKRVEPASRAAALRQRVHLLDVAARIKRLLDAQLVDTRSPRP